MGWGCNKKVRFDMIVGALSVAQKKNNFFPAMVGSVGICKSRAPVQGLLAVFRCQKYGTGSGDMTLCNLGLCISFLVKAFLVILRNHSSLTSFLSQSLIVFY